MIIRSQDRDCRIVYGISDYGLAQGLGISNQEAKAYIDAYFKRYPGVRDYVR
ncbi:hypothetical protein JT739_12660, partial [Tepidanaerobacter sp. GT38]|nr:hypothetical protein [Tepidanaerobacter sp. GT38]